MNATIKIQMDNAAFDEPATELARILRDLADCVEQGEDEITIRDINGNTVGGFKVRGGKRFAT